MKFRFLKLKHEWQSQNLISRKIWVAEKFQNFQTVLWLCSLIVKVYSKYYVKSIFAWFDSQKLSFCWFLSSNSKSNPIFLLLTVNEFSPKFYEKKISIFSTLCFVSLHPFHDAVCWHHVLKDAFVCVFN